MKTKKFDCVEMKRQGAERVQKEITGMSRKQELEYWRKHSEAWKKEIAGKKSSSENVGVNQPHP